VFGKTRGGVGWWAGRVGRGGRFCAGVFVPGLYGVLRPGRFPRRGAGLKLRRGLWCGMVAGACIAKAFEWRRLGPARAHIENRLQHKTVCTKGGASTPR
jgi:hypothetical protein